MFTLKIKPSDESLRIKTKQPKGCQGKTKERKDNTMTRNEAINQLREIKEIINNNYKNGVITDPEFWYKADELIREFNIKLEEI